MTQEKEKAKPVDLGDRLKGKIELPEIDITQYIGQRTKIETVDVYEGKFGYYVKIETKVLQKIEGKETIEIKGTKVFGLQEDKDGNIGWGNDTKLDLFLKKYKVEHFKDLVGVEVILQTETRDKKDYLSFN